MIGAAPLWKIHPNSFPLYIIHIFDINSSVCAKMSFTASLSGQSLTPPVSTTATGTNITGTFDECTIMLMKK
jgi:hypothetical protein